MPGGMSEDMLDRMPDRMPKYMSDRMLPDMSWWGSHEVKFFFFWGGLLPTSLYIFFVFGSASRFGRRRLLLRALLPTDLTSTYLTSTYLTSTDLTQLYSHNSNHNPGPEA